jgi:hypothetical protein
VGLRKGDMPTHLRLDWRLHGSLERSDIRLEPDSTYMILERIVSPWGIVSTQKRASESSWKSGTRSEHRITYEEHRS